MILFGTAFAIRSGVLVVFRVVCGEVAVNFPCGGVFGFGGLV